MITIKNGIVNIGVRFPENTKAGRALNRAFLLSDLGVIIHTLYANMGIPKEQILGTVETATTVTDEQADEKLKEIPEEIRNKIEAIFDMPETEEANAGSEGM